MGRASFQKKKRSNQNKTVGTENIEKNNETGNENPSDKSGIMKTINKKSNRVKIVELFENSGYSKESIKNFFGAFLGKIAQFKFKQVIENSYVNENIHKLAQYSIPDFYFANLSGDKKYLKQIARARNISYKAPFELDPLKLIKNAEENIAAGKQTLKDIAAGKIDAADLINKKAIQTANEIELKRLKLVSQTNEVSKTGYDVFAPKLFDETGNRINAQGELVENAVEKCLPELESSEDGNFAADKILIKKYLFRTLILFVSFYTTICWVQFFFYRSFSERKCGGENGLGCAVADILVPNDSAVRFAESLKDIYIVGPIISPVADYFLKFFYPKFKRYNPFQYTVRFVQTMVSYTSAIAANMKKTSDKKIWFLFILFIIVYVNFWFFENYDQYMRQIQRFESSKITGFICFIFALFYFESFYSDLSGTISSVMTSIFFVPPIGFMFIVCYNIYLYIIISFNSFSSLFLSLQTFLFISLFGIFLYPKLALVEAFYIRPKNLFSTIDIDAEEKINLFDNGWPKFVLNIFHHFYNHCYAILMLLWLLFVFYIFKKHLKTSNLRHNCFYYIGICALTIFFMKLILHFLTKKK